MKHGQSFAYTRKEKETNTKNSMCIRRVFFLLVFFVSFLLVFFFFALFFCHLKSGLKIFSILYFSLELSPILFGTKNGQNRVKLDLFLLPERNSLSNDVLQQRELNLS